MSTRQVVLYRPVRTVNGASDAVPATRLMHSMQPDTCLRGIGTPCIGDGQGIAPAIEMH